MSVIEHNSLKKPAMVAVSAMALLLVGSVVYFRERMFFADASFITFNILDLHRFYIQEHRFGSFVTQLVPWLGQKFHWHLKTILIGYSVSFNAFYLLTSLVLYRMRQYSLVLLLALYYFLIVTESYYWTNNEIHQAVSWVFLAFAVHTKRINGEMGSGLYFVLFPILAFIAVFTHFVVILPLVFLYVFGVLANEEKANMRVQTTSAVILALIVGVKMAMSLNQPYDGSALQGIKKASIGDMLPALNTPVVKMFALRCFLLYWPALIVAASGAMALYKTRRWGQLAWLVASTTGYAVVMGLTYGHFDKNFALYHIESEWASIGVFWAAPFIFCRLAKLRGNTAIVVISILLLVRLCYIVASSGRFTQRNDFKSYVLGKMRAKNIYRLAIYSNDSLTRMLGLKWALPEETLLMSSLEGDRPLRTFRFVDRNDAATLADMQQKPGVSFEFTWLTPKDLDAFYFPTDSTRPYTVVSWEEFNK